MYSKILGTCKILKCKKQVETTEGVNVQCFFFFLTRSSDNWAKRRQAVFRDVAYVSLPEVGCIGSDGCQ